MDIKRDRSDWRNCTVWYPRSAREKTRL